MASVAELNRIAASHNTLFGLKVPEPLAESEVYNPLRRGVQRKYTLNKGKKQRYDNMVLSGKLNQEKLDKYYQLVSNSNDRLSDEEKEALRPWQVNNVVFKPKPPRTKKPHLVPHPPSYPNPRTTKVNMATYLKRVSPHNNLVKGNNQAKPRRNKTRKMRLNLNQTSVLAKNYNGTNSENDGNVQPQRSNRSASTVASEPRESPVRSNKSRR